MFSFVPRCHGLCGSQKKIARPVSMRSWVCCAISAPWSHVSDRRSCSGSVLIDDAMASRTALAPCPNRRRDDDATRSTRSGRHRAPGPSWRHGHEPDRTHEPVDLPGRASPREPGRCLCQYLSLFAQAPVLPAQPAKLFTLLRAQPRRCARPHLSPPARPRFGSPGTTARTREPGPPAHVRTEPGRPSVAGTPPRYGGLVFGIADTPSPPQEDRCPRNRATSSSRRYRHRRSALAEAACGTRPHMRRGPRTPRPLRCTDGRDRCRFVRLSPRSWPACCCGPVRAEKTKHTDWRGTRLEPPSSDRQVR